MQQDKPLRIIHCFRSPVGGIFRHVRDLVIEHSKQGHQVGILCDNNTGGEYEERQIRELAPYLSLGIVRMTIQRAITPSDIGALLRSYREIKSLQPDVLHGHGAKGGAIARLIGSALRVQRYRVARLYTPHGGTLHYSRRSPVGLVALSLDRFLERLSDQLVFVCDYERRTYEEKLGIPRVPFRMVYNGISDAEFVPVPTQSDSVDFLYVGMLRDLKGPDVFIDAFAMTERALGRPLLALIAGDGPDREKYKHQIRTSGLGNRIGMLPPMPARDAFRTSNILVVPSRAEAMPYIVLEALAAGKTLIATRVGGIPEVLGQDNPALTIPGDAADLSRVMVDALTRPGWHAANMPRPDSFKARYSAATMARSIMEIYRGLTA
ncbi:glycosyltransferase family 4 protein [Gellertiella hungarica]|uniref:Glycosyltransferase involved in cell wall biosynthesis n=1 Tax=Gellertiella hungarica TaxID=1572859 RepID=A0A7W6J965_9HYPH|nr:glycosyltransferase family 4 protein [Gellertiella hungarica]MBB4067114.1 glycosyltransferase involved in cell wall biosynthesis [Gellertiella hungarica]